MFKNAFMKKISFVSIVVLCIILLGGCASEPNQEVNIIPQPQQVTVADGGFYLSPKTVINVVKGADDLQPACTFMSTLVENLREGLNRGEWGNEKECDKYFC